MSFVTDAIPMWREGASGWAGSYLTGGGQPTRVSMPRFEIAC